MNPQYVFHNDFPPIFIFEKLVRDQWNLSRDCFISPINWRDTSRFLDGGYYLRRVRFIFGKLTLYWLAVNWNGKSKVGREIMLKTRECKVPKIKLVKVTYKNSYLCRFILRCDIKIATSKSTLREKIVPATRNLRTNSASTMYYKVVITTMNK